ncbi:hypothetical protein E2320_007213 [Naja naja]|nr:hypothetical protein E2320_007213 [Naja naja]
MWLSYLLVAKASFGRATIAILRHLGEFTAKEEARSSTGAGFGGAPLLHAGPGCLIEIVAGEKLLGVEESPTNQQAMKENVEKVLQFVASKKIRMHQTSAKGELNLEAGPGKIASPRPVEEIQAGSRTRLDRHRSRSAVAAAQEAAAALAEVRQDVAGVGRETAPCKERRSATESEGQFSSGRPAEQRPFRVLVLQLPPFSPPLPSPPSSTA